MNFMVRMLPRRIYGNFGVFRKQYHSSKSQAIKSQWIIKPPFPNEQNITRLIQKTIFPLNEIKPKVPILDVPCDRIIGKIDNSLPKKIDIEPVKEISDPTKIYDKKAHRMLIIRRKKMNKHKYKKLHRRLKSVFVKMRKLRTAKKESIFKQEIMAKLKAVETFDAESYVASKLEMYRKVILPNRIHGKLMPQFAVEEFLARKKKRKQNLEDKLERERRMIIERGTLNVDVDEK